MDPAAADEALVCFDRPSPYGMTEGERRRDGDDDDESGSPGRPQDHIHVACVIPVGSSRSGKTSLINALLYDRFDSEYRKTSLCHYAMKYDYVDPAESPSSSIVIEDCFRRRKMERLQRSSSKVDLSLIDISGSHDHAAERQIHYRNADVVMFVYDVTNRNSLTELLDLYYPEACRMKDQHPLEMPHILVGTKMDLFEKVGRQGDHVGEVEASKAASLLGAHSCWSIRTSAKDRTNIEDLKSYLLSLVVANTPRDVFPPSSSSSAEEEAGTTTRRNKVHRKAWLRCVLQ